MLLNLSKKTLIALLTFFVLFLNSCLSLSMDIQMNKDGSGRLFMEYKISSALINTGTLDGNEKYPVIPVGRLDWERTLARINGAKLSSFSENEKNGETIYKIAVDYDNPKALLSVLNNRGNVSSNNFELIIYGDNSPLNLSEYDKDLLSLARGMLADNKFSISFSSSSESAMTVKSGQKTFSPPASAKLIQKGKKVSLSMNITDLIEYSDGLIFKFDW